MDLEKKEIESVELEKVLGEEEGVQLTFLESIVKIVMEPVEVFKSICMKPRILLPYLLITVVLLLTTTLMWEPLKEFTMKSMKYSMELQGQGDVELPDGMLKAIFMWMFLGMVFVAGLIVMLKGAIVHLFLQLFDSKGTFKQTISVILTSYLVVLIGVLIKTPIVMLSGNSMITFSPAIFLSQEKMVDPVFNLLALFDVFSLWYLGLSILGIAIVHKISKTKAAIVVLVPYFIMVVFSALGVIFS